MFPALTVFIFIFFTLVFIAGTLFMPKYSYRTVSCPFYFADNPVEDDSDIKIAGKENPEKNSELSVEKEVGELKTQRKNGNLDKARLLGKDIYKKIISQDGESSFGEDDTAEDTQLRKERRQLLVFTAIDTVESKMKSRVLAGIVTNEIYNELKTNVPEFYSDIKESGSFSFYTLCVRRGKDIQDTIGQTFAMLAGKSGDSVTAELGKALYIRFFDVTVNTIDSFNISQ